MCFGGAPKVEKADPEGERLRAEAEAAAKANEQLLADARRRRQQKGVMATDSETGAGSVLASGGGSAKAAPSTVLGSGGA